MLPNNSRLPPYEEKEFLAGSRINSALEKVGSVYFRNGFWKDVFEELTSTVLSTAAARSDVGQGLSFFVPMLRLGMGVTLPPFHLFCQLLDGLMELGCVRGSTVVAS